MTVREAIEGFQIDNGLLAGKEDGTVERNIMAIEALKVMDSQRWIPVEERLPAEYGSYLVAWIPVGLGIEYEHYYEILEFDPDDESGWIERIEQSPGDYEILAWMHLPEHYKPKN